MGNSILFSLDAKKPARSKPAKPTSTKPAASKKSPASSDSPSKKGKASKKSNPWDTDSDDELGITKDDEEDPDISEIKPREKTSQRATGMCCRI